MRKIKSLPVFKGKYSKKEFVTEITQHIEGQLSADRYLVPYFVTTIFADYECKSKKQLEHKIEYAFRQYDRVYRHLISLLMNNFSKKRHLHPRTFDFVDLPGTRHTFKINACEPSTPHIHSVYLVHNKTLEQFENLRATGFAAILKHHSFKNVTAIHASPIAAGTIYRVVDYSAKLLGNYAAIAAADDVPLFTQFPITKDEQRTRRDALRFESMLHEQEKLNLSEKYMVPTDHPLARIINSCSAAYI